MNHYDDINLKLGRAAAGRSFKHVVAVIHEGGADPIDQIEYPGEIISLKPDRRLREQLLDFVRENRDVMSGEELSDLTNNDLMDMVNFKASGPVVITAKGLHDFDDRRIEEIIMSAHYGTQRGHKVLFMASGPEELMGLMGEIRPYSERLFDFLHMEKPESSADPEP